MAKKVQGGLAGIRAAFEDASRLVSDEIAVLHHDPNLPFSVDDKELKAGKWPGFPHYNLPPKCPVQVIGQKDGVTFCVSATGQLVGLEEITAQTLFRLFAPHTDYLYWAWPAYGGKKKTDAEGNPLPPQVERVERDKAAQCLINEGARRGLFEVADRHRGRGGWKGAFSGDFLWHSGNRLWRVERGKLKAALPGEIEGFLYTRQPPTIEPWSQPVDETDTPAQAILAELRTWKWERPYLDPILVLGWIGSALMGGALKARPIVFTTGGAGVGKSTLHELIKELLAGGIFASVDTTAAGVYQRVKQDSLPILIDEIENKPGSNKAQSVIELARVSYTGGDISRGGADHEGTTFRMHNSFFFSAINPPPLGTQDKTRMAILNLARLDTARGIGKTSRATADHGRMLLRQVMDGWTKFNGEILPYWDSILSDIGLDSRARDTYGTLLAAAELLVGSKAIEAAGLPIADPVQLGEMLDAATKLERSEQLDNWRRCLEHILQSTLPNYTGGIRKTVGQTLEEIERDRSGSDFPLYQTQLAGAGLGVRKSGDPFGGLALAVPTNNSPQLLAMFENSEWRGGGWTTALKQGPQDIIVRNSLKRVMKINRVSSNCLLVDLKAYDKAMDEPLGG